MKKIYLLIALIITILILTGCTRTYTIDVEYDADMGIVEGAGTYEEGSSVNLKASPNEGNVFIHWEEDGKILDTDIKISFIANNNREIVASFKPISEIIDIEINDELMGTVSINQLENTGKVSIKAIPNQYCSFESWSGDVGKIDIQDNEIILDNIQEINLRAHFKVNWNELINKSLLEGHLYKITKSNEVGYINKNGEEVIRLNPFISMVDTYYEPSNEVSYISSKYYNYVNKQEITESPIALVSKEVAFLSNKGEILSVVPSEKLHMYGYYSQNFDWNYNKYGVISYKGNKFGFVNYQGSEIIPHEYDSFPELREIDEKFIILSKEDKFGVINSETGKIEIDFIYDRIEWFSSEFNIFRVEKDSTELLVDIFNSSITDLSKIKIQRFAGDNTYLIYSENNMYGIYDLKEKAFLSDPIFEEIRIDQDDSFIVKIDDMWGLIDNNLDYIIKSNFDSLSAFDDGKARYSVGNETGLVTTEGNTYSLGEIDNLYSIHSLIVYEKNGKFGIVKSNNDITEALYEKVNFNEGSGDPMMFFASKNHTLFQKEGFWAIYDSQKDEFVTDFIFHFDNSHPYSFVFNMSGSLSLRAKIEGEDNFSLYNVTLGKTIINSSDYDDFGFLVDDRAWVKIDDKYGFIDKEGSLITDPIYDEVTNFIHGVACVRINDEVGYLNKDGDYIIDLTDCDSNPQLEYNGEDAIYHGSGNLYFDKSGKIIHGIS